VALGKEIDIVTITFAQMNREGEFDCPKCKVKINPDMENEFEVIEEETKGTQVVIKHLCGQKIRIELGGVAE